MNYSEESIVYFDGVCGLCNTSVDWFMRRNKRKRLKFAALQGSTAQDQLKVDPDQEFDTIIFADRGEIHHRSTAIIKMCVRLGGGWVLMYGLMVFPRFIRDFVYNIVARNRYKWFGKKDSCRMPTPEERAFFLP